MAPRPAAVAPRSLAFVVVLVVVLLLGTATFTYAAQQRISASKPAARPKPAAAARPPAFHVPGARKEPLEEMPLPTRAERLVGWLAVHPRPTRANVRYWLYQNAWIVTGARFGWWHGAEALRILVAADQKAQRVWGIGHRSEAVARRALVDVKRRSR